MNDKIKPYLAYVNFGKEGYPAVITKNHLEELRGGDYLFARKFDDNSQEIIKTIDTTFRKPNVVLNQNSKTI